MVELGDQLDTITPDAAGVATLAAWIDEFTTLYATYAPVFSAFQAASRDHEPLADGSSTISDRLGTALLHGFEVHGHGTVPATLATGLVAVLIRCSFYWESIPGTLPRERLIDGLAQLVHRLFIGPIDGVNLPSATATRRPQARGRTARTDREHRPRSRLAPPRRADPPAVARRRHEGAARLAATTTRGSTTSSRWPASRTAASTATSRTRTTSSGCWPNRRAGG